MRILFSKDVIDYVIRNKTNPERKRAYNRLSKSLDAFKYCDNCFHLHYEDYKSLNIKDRCYYCNCKSFKSIPFRLEIFTLANKIEFKYIHKAKSSLYWKLVELEIKQSQVINDYVYSYNKTEI